MLYTEMTNKAMRFSYEAHEGQYDKNGIPYIFHPYHLAEQMNDEASICVALLHDVVEDTDYTIEDIAALGFSEEVVAAIACLTKPEHMPYMDYIRKIKRNPLATKVKLADLDHNSDISRLPEISEKAMQRVRKYREAKEILSEERL